MKMIGTLCSATKLRKKHLIFSIFHLTYNFNAGPDKITTKPLLEIKIAVIVNIQGGGRSPNSNLQMFFASAVLAVKLNESE
jgi:hypothetical protein